MLAKRAARHSHSSADRRSKHSYSDAPTGPALGLVVGVGAGVGLLLDFEPARLPRELLNIAAYKLTFLATGGLLAAGALALR